MQLGHKIRFSYPDGPGQPPICRSWDVIQEFGLQKEASEFLQYDVRARRAFTASKPTGSQHNPLIYKMVPGAGIEPARLAAGDFELACKGVFVGKRGESERRFIRLNVIINQQVSVIS